MTYDILNSILKKDRLYKLILKTDVHLDKYAALKDTFKQYKETLRRSNKEAKQLYYHSCITCCIKIMSEKRSLLQKKHYEGKRNMNCLRNLYGIIM